jgi:hypothetical protein
MADFIFHGQFIDKTNLDGETGLTVTIDIYRTTIADGTTSQVVTDGSCTETGGGIYRYRLASADPTLYHYAANLKTASSNVAQKHAAALGMVVPSGQADTLGATALASVNAEVVDVLRTDTLPDSYAALGAQPTIAQAVLMICQYLTERSVTGTTVTVKKPNGATAAMTFTLDNNTIPTAQTRAS